MSRKPGHEPHLFYGWWIVAGGFLIQMLNGGLLFHAFSAYVLPLQAAFGWNRTQATAAFAMARAESGILGPIQGWLIDRYGPRTIMLIGNTLFGLGFILFSRMDSLLTFYASFAVVALGSSLGGFMPIATTVTNWFVRRRSAALGIMLSGQGLGGLVIPGLVWFLSTYGWRTTALTSGILVLVIGLPASLLMRRRPEDQGLLPDGRQSPASRGPRVPGTRAASARPAEPNFTARQALRTPTFWLLALVHGSALLIVSSVLVHQIPHMVEGIGLSQEKAASVVAVLVIITMSGQLVGGYLGDRLNKRFCIFAAMWLHAAGMVIFTYATSAIGALAFTVLHGIAWGTRGTLINAIRADYFGRASFATIMGFNSLLVMIGMTIGPVFSALIRDLTGDYRAAFLVLAGIAAVSSIAALLAHPPPVPLQTGDASTGDASRADSS